MREALQSSEKDDVTYLQDLALEGTRIPVEIDGVKMLLSEIDAKNWSAIGMKWVPAPTNSGDADESAASTQAKLEDIRDHLEKGESLREKVALPPNEREQWTLDGEDQLRAIVNSADEWFDTHLDFLIYDSRRSTEGQVYASIEKLRQIVNEMNAIHANIGSISKKMSKILAQAEAWYEQASSLLVRCGLLESNGPDAAGTSVTLDEIVAAVETAEADVSIGLEEARKLEELLSKIRVWNERVEDAAPKRNKRVGKGSKYSKVARYSVSDVVDLIDESKHLPIRTDEEVDRLTKQLEDARHWQREAHKELQEITNGFQGLRQAVDLVYGPPEEFYSEETRANDKSSNAKSDSTAESMAHSEQKYPSTTQPEETSAELASQNDSASVSGSEVDTKSLSKLGGGGGRLQKMISSLLKDARNKGVYTAEEQAAELLDKIVKWCVKSMSYIDSTDDVYDKKEFAPFDKFIEAGRELLDFRETFAKEIDSVDNTLVLDLTTSWTELVSDQLVRLQALQSHRDKFIEWTKAAEAILSGKEKRATLDEIKAIYEESNEYPYGKSRNARCLS
jgi:hypothetical protein